MQTVLIVIHLMIVSAMIGLVLLQKSEGGGLGMGGGGGGFLTSRGTSNGLTRTTAIFAAGFLLPSLTAAVWQHGARPPQPPPPGAPNPGTARVGPAPAAPAAPSGPQVPRSQ